MAVRESYRVTLEERDDEAVVVVTGEIDLAAQDRLLAVIDQARALGEQVVIDLSQTTFIDSSGLKVLRDAWLAQTEAGGGIVLRAPSPAVQRVIAMMGMRDFLLPVQPSPAT